MYYLNEELYLSLRTYYPWRRMKQPLQNQGTKGVVDESLLPKTVKVEKDSPIRSIAKTISWRIFATATTILVSYLVTGSVTLAFQIGGVEVVLKLIVFYFHERAWANITWGKIWYKNQLIRAIKYRYLLYKRAKIIRRRS